jgi:hypothetical protein
MMDVVWVNNLGILMEIAGFIMILCAIKQMRPKGGGFQGIFDYVGNVMSTRHPWVNRIGILMVIVGLGGQLASNTIPYWMTLQG